MLGIWLAVALAAFGAGVAVAVLVYWLAGVL
jgi:hypothetical protein